MCNALNTKGEDYRLSKNNKLRKKVSNYKDKHGTIRPEFKSCIIWANNLKNNKSLFCECYNQLIEYFSIYKKKKLKDLKNQRYIRDKLKSVIRKNSYPMTKLGKSEGYSIYSIENVAEFILLLLEAVKLKKIKEFLDVPDVFYIARQIKNIGIEYYFARL